MTADKVKLVRDFTLKRLRRGEAVLLDLRPGPLRGSRPSLWNLGWKRWRSRTTKASDIGAPPAHHQESRTDAQ